MTPFISCLMPTHNRRPLIRHALDCWHRQDWPEDRRELIVMDDSHDRIDDLLPPGGRVRHYWCQGKRKLGWKRNALARLANGTILAHWDDDDWYHPRRLTEQYEQLTAGGYDLVGYNLFGLWDERDGSAFRYSNPDPEFMCGSSMMYRREAWERRPFFDALEVAEDNAFLHEIANRRGFDGSERMVARVHALSLGAMRKCVDLMRTHHLEQYTDNYAEIDPEMLPREFPRGGKIAA